MNFIMWNKIGDDNASFRRWCRAMVNIHMPVMLVLHERKINTHRSLTDYVMFYSQILFSKNGILEQIVIMLNCDTLKLENLSITPKESLYLSIYYRTPHLSFMIVVYVILYFNTRTYVWKEVGSLSNTNTSIMSPMPTKS